MFRAIGRGLTCLIAFCLIARPSAAELLKHKFFQKSKNKEYLMEKVFGQLLSGGQRNAKSENTVQASGTVPKADNESNKKVRRVQGSSGHLYKTEDGGWEWSDEESGDAYNERKPPASQKAVSALFFRPGMGCGWWVCVCVWAGGWGAGVVQAFGC
uniref:Uncharacterized protein n=1 Tax=Callorhinchus milii TaxID=7868 RepID=A0A4W3HHP8_CALMI